MLLSALFYDCVLVFKIVARGTLNLVICCRERDCPRRRRDAARTAVCTQAVTLYMPTRVT